MPLHSLRWLQKKLVTNESTLVIHCTSAAISGTYPSSGVMGAGYVSSAYGATTFVKSS